MTDPDFVRWAEELNSDSEFDTAMRNFETKAAAHLAEVERTDRRTDRLYVALQVGLWLAVLVAVLWMGGVL